MIRVLAALLAAAVLAGGEPTLDAWAQGRPAEALPGLIAAAEASDAWHAWLDAGLCAAAAGDRGRAAAYVLRARRLAPGRPEPRQAELALDLHPAPLWTDRLGPLARPGAGWLGIVLLAGMGVALGLALGLPRRRGWAAAAAGALAVAALPGVVAAWRDRGDAQRALIADSQLLDATGTPLAALPAASVVERLPGDPWAGRIAVRAADGRTGFVPAADLGP